MTTVLVTGATGTVGSHLVRELCGRGVSVRAFVREPDRAAAILGDQIELAMGDFAEPGSIRGALEGVERVFLACGNDPRQVEYETNVIEAAAEVGVRRIVKLSAMGAEVGSLLAFWDWHGRIERHLHGVGIPAVILQPSFYMSNLLASAAAIKQTGQLFAPAGNARIAMIDPRDVAAAAAGTLTEDGHDGKTYRLTGSEAITFDEIAAHLSTATGRRIEFVDLPDAAARAALVQAGMPDWMAVQLVILFGLLRQNSQAKTTDAVRSLIGREPGGFAEFVGDHADLFGC